MESPPSPRVAVVSQELEVVDRLQEAISMLGLEPIPLFSAGEAVGAMRGQAVGAVVLDTAVEESDALRQWMDRHYRGVVVLVHDLDRTPGRARDDGEMESDPDAVEVAVRLLKALRP